MENERRQGMVLTRQERAILTQLQEDCRQTTAALAEKVAMSTTPCWRAVRRLEDAGIIDGYRASIQPSKLGYTVNALMTVQVDSHRDEHALEFEEAVRREERIVECLMIAMSLIVYLAMNDTRRNSLIDKEEAD